jgi:hypothetical protein
VRERAQQIERGGGLRIGAQHALRVRNAAFGGEVDAVDVVAKVARQRPHRQCFSTGEERGLANWPAMRPTFTTGCCCGEREDDRHLQQHAERVADVVRMELGEALRAVAALEQETLACGDFGEIGLQRAGFAGEHQRGKPGQRFLDRSELRRIGISGQVLGFCRAPAVRIPVRCHGTRFPKDARV